MQQQPPTETVELRQQDYANGTYIMRSNTRYVFMEDIVFHPNPDNDFLPTSEQIADGTYNAMATTLGFTTANQIGGHDIDVDLNGHTMQQSAEHALQQRFFSFFQFGATPFIDKAGPVDFVDGDAFVGPQRVTIRNGTLGRSSHHGIQGNECREVVLENLRIHKFEIAAVSTNLVDEMTIRKCTLGPNFTSVPVEARYSQARFIRQFVREVSGHSLASATTRVEASSVLAELDARMSRVRNDVLSGGSTDDALFGNPSGLIDGIAYGLLVHGKGPAVNDFSPMPVDGAEPEGATQFSQRLRLYDVHIDGIESAPRQVVGLSMPAGSVSTPGVYGGGVQHDPAGGVLNVLSVWNRETDEYVPNVLSDAQAFVAAHRYLLAPRTAARVTISAGVTAWMRTPGAKLADVLADEELYFRYNGDSMFHVLKGNIGLRLDRVHQAVLQNVTVTNCHNRSTMHGTVDGAPFDFSHPSQTVAGYQGCASRGMSLSACRKVRCRDLKVDGVTSTHDYAVGVDILNESEVSFADEFLQVTNVRGVSDAASFDVRGAFTGGGVAPDESLPIETGGDNQNHDNDAAAGDSCCEDLDACHDAPYDDSSDHHYCCDDTNDNGCCGGDDDDDEQQYSFAFWLVTTLIILFLLAFAFVSIRRKCLLRHTDNVSF
jgi:hypothetical protein